MLGGEVDRVVVGDHPQHRADRAGQLKLDGAAIARGDRHAVDSGEGRGVDGPGEPRANGLGGAGAQVLDGLGGDEPALLDDRDSVGQALHLVELVRGPEHGPALCCHLAHQPGELAAHQRIQARGRLVEHEQVRPAHEGQDQADLLPVARGQLPGGAVEHGVEPLGERVGEREIPQAPGPGVPGDVLAPGHPRIQREFPGQVAGPPVDLDAVPARSQVPGSPRCRRSAAAGPAASGWSWSCPPRSGRGTRTPGPARPPGPGR